MSKQLIPAPTMKEIIDAGYLTDYKVFAPIPALNQPSLTYDVIQHWKKYAENKKTIVFCNTIVQAEFVAEQFRNAGVSAEGYHNGYSNAVKAHMKNAFQNEDLTVLCTCQGLRDESLPETECVIMLHVTASAATHRRFTDAARAPKEGKTTPVIIDLAGNFARNGWPND